MEASKKRSGKRPPLTPEQKQWIEEYLAAYETPMKIVNGHFASLKRRILLRGWHEHDVESMAYHGLVEALYSWSPDGGNSFASWVFRSVQSRLIRLFRFNECRKRNGVTISGNTAYGEGDGISSFEMLGESDELQHRENLQPLIEAMKWLDPRDRRILELRFGFDGPPMTLEEVAAELGVTRERVRQIEMRAKGRIRNRLRCTQIELEMLGLTA